MKTAWGVTLGVEEIPVPELVTYADHGLYGWKIEKHGIIAIACSQKECREEFVKSYLGETEIDLTHLLEPAPQLEPATIH